MKGYEGLGLLLVTSIVVGVLIALILFITLAPKPTSYPDSVDCQPLDGSAPVTCVDVVQPEEPGVAKAYCRTDEGVVLGCDLWIRRG